MDSRVWRGGEGSFLDSEPDHFTPTWGIRPHVRALARNHLKEWKLQGHAYDGLTTGTANDLIMDHVERPRGELRLQHVVQHHLEGYLAHEKLPLPPRTIVMA